MRVVITFNVGDGKGWNHNRHFEFEQVDAGTFERDFLTYINGGIGALSGAAYKCVDPETSQPRELALRFADILYVEFMPQSTTGPESLASQSSQAAPKNPISGPLQARLSTSPLHPKTGTLGTPKEDE